VPTSNAALRQFASPRFRMIAAAGSQLLRPVPKNFKDLKTTSRSGWTRNIVRLQVAMIIPFLNAPLPLPDAHLIGIMRNRVTLH
jgi:hypothetical protein